MGAARHGCGERGRGDRHAHRQGRRQPGGADRRRDHQGGGRAPRGRLTRFLPAVAAGLLAALWPAAPAAAHGSLAPAGTNYRTAITSVTPAVPGLTVRSIDIGQRLELVNHTGRTIEVLGYDGKPFVQVAPGQVARWHDHRVHWMAKNPPPRVAADPTQAYRIRDWVVPLRDGSSTVEVRGTLDWLPPPAPGTWWAMCLAGAAGLAGLGLALRHSAVGGVALAVAAAAGGTASIAYAVAHELDGGAIGAGGVLRGLLVHVWLVLTSLAAIAAAAYALRLAAGRAGRSSADLALALAGACLFLSVGLPHATVFSRSVAPVSWDGSWARAAVAVVIVAGAGVTAAGVLRIRSASRESASRESASRDGVRDKVPA